MENANAKCQYLGVRVTSKTYLLVSEAAEKAGITMSQFVLSALEEKIDKPGFISEQEPVVAISNPIDVSKAPTVNNEIAKEVEPAKGEVLGQTEVKQELSSKSLMDKIYGRKSA